MKNLHFLIFAVLFLFTVSASTQTITYLKAADKPEYAKYSAYCDSLTRVEVIQYGKATVVKPPTSINYEMYKMLKGGYSNKLLKDTIWYPPYKYGNLATALSLTKDQVLIFRYIVIQVPRRVKSVNDFYVNWMTGKIQQSWRGLQ